MIDKAFSLFGPHVDRFDCRFFTKADHLRTDADLAGALGDDRIASLHQVHGDRTIIARRPMNRKEQADGLATDEPGLWLSVRAADCQQVVVYDPAHHAAGAVHAGWKGLKAGAIPSLFAAMRAEWGTNPADVLVGIGPSICTACAEFTDPTQELAGLDAAFFHGRHADLQGIADAQLEALGVQSTQRERHPACTKCESATLWSYRGGDRGAVQAGHCNVVACRLR